MFVRVEVYDGYAPFPELGTPSGSYPCHTGTLNLLQKSRPSCSQLLGRSSQLSGWAYIFRTAATSVLGHVGILAEIEVAA